MRRTNFAVVLVLVLLAALTAAGVASAAVTTDSSKLRAAVTTKGIMKHENQFQAIANANNDTRASGTPGYDASAEYVAGKLRAAGYNVTVQPFTFPFFQELAPTTFSQTAPTAKTYQDGTDFLIMEYSGSGNVVDKAVVPTNDVQIPPGPTASSSNSGCEASDFVPASTTEQQVALIQRGTCTFAEKAQNAEAAGYDAAIIFNEGQEGRRDVLNGTLGGPSVTIPVIGTTFAVGEELYKASPGARVSISATTLSENRNTTNVIADTKTGRTDRVVVVGAHLDSVPEGPGINDNGSGTATILEVALQMSKLGIQPRNQVRFAFWGAEESGLLGAEHYVSTLSKSQLNDIAVNLNFDMVGSPNYVRFVYDGDGSDTGTSGPTGSGVVEDVFNDYFASQGLQTEPTAFDGRSDYGPFIAVGIPAGGLFTGAEGIKTAEEAAIYGGTAGVAYDPCYHQACDDITNLSKTALDQMSDATAHATLAFAQTTSAVGGTEKGAGTPSSKLEYKGPKAQK
jgi:Zn-dependent M28 family amino/carboxypeptidase